MWKTFSQMVTLSMPLTQDFKWPASHVCIKHILIFTKMGSQQLTQATCTLTDDEQTLTQIFYNAYGIHGRIAYFKTPCYLSLAHTIFQGTARLLISLSVLPVLLKKKKKKIAELQLLRQHGTSLCTKSCRKTTGFEQKIYGTAFSIHINVLCCWPSPWTLKIKKIVYLTVLNDSYSVYSTS